MMITKSDTQSLDWIALAPGAWFKPVRFDTDGGGWTSLVRLSPGTKVPRHRHAGATRGYTLQGIGRFIEQGVEIAPGTYTYEPAGTIDTLIAEGDEDLIVLFSVGEAVEFLNEDDTVARRETQQTKITSYRDNCQQSAPDEEAFRF